MSQRGYPVLDSLVFARFPLFTPHPVRSVTGACHSFSNASEGMEYIGCRFLSLAGYRDSELRLVEGFAHDAKRIARPGTTMTKALRTNDGA